MIMIIYDAPSWKSLECLQRHKDTFILSRTHAHTHAHTHAQHTCTTHMHTHTHAHTPAHTHAHTHTHSLHFKVQLPAKQGQQLAAKALVTTPFRIIMSYPYHRRYLQPHYNQAMLCGAALVLHMQIHTTPHLSHSHPTTKQRYVVWLWFCTCGSTPQTSRTATPQPSNVMWCGFGFTHADPHHTTPLAQPLFKTLEALPLFGLQLGRSAVV